MSDKEPSSASKPSDSTGSPQAGLASFWAELKRRKVMRVAITYAVVSWVIIQVAATTFGSFGIPEWAFRFVVLMVVLGFPVALIITWAFELTPDGIKTTKGARKEGGHNSVSKKELRKRNWLTILFAAGLPTLIFGSLAFFFYLRSGSVEPSEAATDENAIAVMPLVNMSSHEENVHFAGGIHEDVLTHLSRIEGLQVKSRTSMLKYAATEMTLGEIGRELGAKFIVEGSVRRIGNHVRVTIQLIDASNENHLWANNFERELIDVFATQSELAKEISASLHLEIQPDSVGKLEGMPTTSVKAYDLYTRAANLEKTEGETEAVMILRRAMLEEAVEVDPDFVEAWAVLKRVYDLMLSRLGQRGWYLTEGDDTEKVVEDFRDRSRRALEKAIALDPDNVETLLASAVDHIWPQSDEVNQERKAIFDQILATDPDHAMARYHLGWLYWNGQDQQSEALTAFEEALKSDPFNARIVRGLLTRYRVNGDQENVTRLVERLTQIVPETAADRSLARVGAIHILNQFEQAFLDTADEAILEEMEASWLDGSLSTADVPIWNDVSAVRIHAFNNDEEKIIALSRKPVDLGVSEHITSAFCHLKIAELVVLLNRGQLSEARVVAQQILEVEDIARSQLISDGTSVQSALIYAHVALGNVNVARPLANIMLESGRPSGAGLSLMSHVDTERAVEFAFAELARNPDWDGFDEMAAYQLYHRPFLLHPKVQEYYVNEGKWIDYLSDRVPEYAEFGTQ